MSIPGLATIKMYGLIAVSFLAVIFWSLLNAKKAEFAKAKLKGEVQARKTAQATNKAMMDGLDNEKDELNKARTSGKRTRDGFE